MTQPTFPRSGSEPPRVLFFSHEATLSGAPIALFHLACWLQDSGKRPVVAVPERGPISDLLQSRGIEVVIDAAFLADSSQGKLLEICAGFDVVVANTIASWAAVRAARAAGARAIWYLHETLVAIDLIGKISEIGPTLDHAHLLITPTQQTANVYRGLTRTAIEVVPYGIPEPVGFGKSDDTDRRLKFVALGSYEPRKGQDVLLEAIRRLAPEVRSVASFTMAGRVLDQSFFDTLTGLRAGLENVELASAVDHSGSLRLLADADVLVCASRDETMPISIIEAMSLGKVVVSTDVGGVSEWLHDRLNGFLAPREDPARLAKALSDCITDPARRSLCGAAARRTFAQHFTLEQFGSRFAAAIDLAANEPLTTSRPGAEQQYRDWIVLYDTPTAGDRIALVRQMRSLRNTPIISVLLPVYNPDLTLLVAAVDSVRQQSYQHLQLCIADDASTDPAIRPLLETLAAADERIRVTFRTTNGHISAASNSALELATGEWCALLDQDDALVEHAFAFVALEIAANPDARVIYSDEDKMDVEGVRSNPFFKTDWNPELFQGQNYINHLGVYHTALLRNVGGFREGFEGSQDYDLASRCCERLRREQVRHIPRILYHWRMAPGSLAEVPDAKPYAKEAARRALADHLQRCGIAGRVEPCPENTESHRVIYPVPEQKPLVTIIIPTRDRVALLQQCVQSIS
nr:glycosyltransferase [Chthoniobacterales bacterium]